MSGGPEEDAIISVAELNRRLKRVVENESGGFWVEGEVTSLKRASSGHLYFTLKDEEEDACIECVMYRFDALRAARHISDGARVQLLGRATLWAPRGRLQFVAQRARPKGRGALLAALEALKQRLADEGLFAPERKRALPAEPKVIGVVTSGSGAAFHDICSVALRRSPVHLVLAPARVQGDGAVRSLVVALDRLERYPGIDVVIIGRGGGSGEDLMAFNDERVVRRVARCNVPVVSAVGHEIDISLCDLAADLRAATPSQAAELVVPDALQRQEALESSKTALARAIRRHMMKTRSEAERLRAKLSDPRFLIAERQQELHEADARLRRHIDRALSSQKHQISEVLARLLAQHPRAVIARHRSRMEPLRERLRSSMRAGLAERRSELGLGAGRLEMLSPLAVLARGYSIALDPSGRAVRRADALEPGQRLRIILGEGSLESVVERVFSSSNEVKP